MMRLSLRFATAFLAVVTATAPDAAENGDRSPAAQADLEARLARIPPVLNALRRTRRAAISADFEGWSGTPPDPSALPPPLLSAAGRLGWSREAVALVLRVQGLAGPEQGRVPALEQAAALGDLGAAAALAEYWFDAGDHRRAAAWAVLAGERGAVAADGVAVALPLGPVPAETRTRALTRLLLGTARPPGLAGELRAGRPEAIARARAAFQLDALSLGPATDVICAPVRRGETLDAATEARLRDRAVSLPDAEAAACLVQSALAAVNHRLASAEAAEPPAWIADLTGPIIRDVLIETSLRTQRLGRHGVGVLALAARVPAVTAKRPEAPAWLLGEAAGAELDRRDTDIAATTTITSDAQEAYAAALTLLPAPAQDAAFAALEPARRALWPERGLPRRGAGDLPRSGYAGLLVKDLTSTLIPPDASADRTATGALVVGFTAGTPASGTLRVGDVVSTFAGRPIAGAEALIAAIGQATPGAYRATILRGGTRMEVTLPVAAWPEKAAPQSNLASRETMRVL